MTSFNWAITSSLLLVLLASNTADAFINQNQIQRHVAPASLAFRPPSFVLSSVTDSESTGSAFRAPEATDEDEDEEEGDDVDPESLESRSRKAKRGKRKKGSSKSTTAALPTKSALAPEEVFYEGPPAITETIIPTISILTVVGIIPAAAAWARQAWVRYKITTRRIRVTSGIGGKDMAEIVYPDIVELRTVKRLFGDGDMVAFLRDGAKFEMRNIPNFDEALEFMLKQVDPEVAKTYRQKGDVTNP